MGKLTSNKYFVKSCEVYDKCLYFKDKVGSIKEIPSDIVTDLVKRAPPVVRDGIFKTFGDEPIPAYGGYYLVTMVLDNEDDDTEKESDPQSPPNKYKLSTIELDDVLVRFETIELKKDNEEKSPTPHHVFLFDDSPNPSFIALMFSDVNETRKQLIGTMEYMKLKWKRLNEKRKYIQTNMSEKFDMKKQSKSDEVSNKNNERTES